MSESPRLCPTCGCSLECLWPYLDRKAMAAHHSYNIESWKFGATSGCDFCRTVMLVIDYARTEYQLDPDFAPTLEIDNMASFFHNDMKETRMVSVVWGQKFEDRHVPSIGVHGDNCRYYGIMIYPEENDSPLEAYSPIFQDRALPHALDLARQWLAACGNKHSCCKQPSNGFVPDRLLEITDDSIKLRVKPQKAESYVALSHCWGSTKPIVLSAENLDSLQEGLSWTDLPQTFKEAARVAQNLGFRFIWIDTLCIIQDSEADWEEQSTLMASIYGNATLVLAASAAKSTEDGFLTTKYNSPIEARLKLARSEHHQSIDRYLCTRLEASYFNRRGPLDKRAWAYQEEAVSRRYLAYAESGMEWSCTQTRYSEIGHYLPMREIGKPTNLINMFNSCRDTDMLRAYWSTEVVVSYKLRKLTVQSDILLALSAIAKEFQVRTKWTYLAGLWKEDLVRGLAWVCDGDILPEPGPHRRTSQNKYEQKYCPSWSWASVDNDVIMTAETLLHSSRRYFEAVATVVEAYTLPGPMGPFGLVHDGLVVLRGPSAFVTFELGTSGRVVSGSLSSISALLSDETGICKTHPNAQSNFYQDAPLVRTSFVLNDNTVERSTRRRTSLNEELPEDSPIDYEDEHITNAWLISLAMDGDDNYGFLECLVLGRVGTDPDRFQRLGLYTANCKKHAETDHCDFHESLGGMEIREFAIV